MGTWKLIFHLSLLVGVTLADYCCNFDETTCGWANIGTNQWKWTKEQQPDLTYATDFATHGGDSMYFQTESFINGTQPLAQYVSDYVLISDGDEVSIDMYIYQVVYDGSRRPALYFDDNYGRTTILLFTYTPGWSSVGPVICGTTNLQCCAQFPCIGKFRVDGKLLNTKELLAFDSLKLNKCPITTTTTTTTTTTKPTTPEPTTPEPTTPEPTTPEPTTPEPTTPEPTTPEPTTPEPTTPEPTTPEPTTPEPTTPEPTTPEPTTPEPTTPEPTTPEPTTPKPTTPEPTTPEPTTPEPTTPEPTTPEPTTPEPTTPEPTTPEPTTPEPTTPEPTTPEPTTPKPTTPEPTTLEPTTPEPTTPKPTTPEPTTPEPTTPEPTTPEPTTPEPTTPEPTTPEPTTPKPTTPEPTTAQPEPSEFCCTFETDTCKWQLYEWKWSFDETPNWNPNGSSIKPFNHTGQYVWSQNTDTAYLISPTIKNVQKETEFTFNYYAYTSIFDVTNTIYVYFESVNSFKLLTILPDTADRWLPQSLICSEQTPCCDVYPCDGVLVYETSVSDGNTLYAIDNIQSSSECTNSGACCQFEKGDVCGIVNIGQEAWKWSGASKPDTSSIPSFTSDGDYLWYQRNSLPPGNSVNAIIRTESVIVYPNSTFTSSIFLENAGSNPLTISFHNQDNDKVTLLDFFTNTYDKWETVTLQCHSIHGDCCSQPSCAGWVEFTASVSQLAEGESILYGLDNLEVDDQCANLYFK